MKSFTTIREATQSADKKPEKYTKPDGKVGVRMVPVDKEVVKEEDLDEISLSNLTKTIAKSTGTKNINKAMGKDKIKKDLEAMKARLATNEKTLTPAEKKKREEIAKAMEKENPGMDMSKKMAIATATAKRVAEANDDQYHKTLAKTKNSDEGIEALKKKHGMSHDQAKKTLSRLMGMDEAAELDEAQGTAAKYAGKSGMFGGKYTSKDHMAGMKNFSQIRKQRAAQRDAEHQKQDPKMAKMGYAKHMLDTDKADAKAKKRGIDPTGKYDKYKKANNIKDSVQVDEVLDTPQAMKSYRDKAKASKEKAANSAAAKIMRSKDDKYRAHPAKELKTMAKRTAGEKMADRNAVRKTFKMLRKEK